MRGHRLNHITIYLIAVLALAVCLVFTSTAMATDEWEGNVDNDWIVGGNWSHGTVPAGGTTRIQSNGTADLSTTATTGQLIIGSEFSDDDGVTDGAHAGAGTLNVLPGADLTMTALVMGEFDDDGDTSDSIGTVNQSGGTVTVNAGGWFYVGNNGSGPGTGIYSISGGTFTSNVTTSDNLIGLSSSTHGEGTLQVIGSAPTITFAGLLQFGDLGHLAVEFDSGGVSTVVADSIVIWGAGNNDLDVTLGPTAAFNINDVFPILHGNNGLNNAQFGGLPENAIIQIDSLDTFRINYNPGSSNNQVTLTALRTVAPIPEPSTLALLALGALTMFGRKPKHN